MICKSIILNRSLEHRYYDLTFFFDNLLGGKCCPMVLICMSLMTKELNIVCVYFLCNLMCCITIVILMETLSYIIPRGS